MDVMSMQPQDRILMVGAGEMAQWKTERWPVWNVFSEGTEKWTLWYFLCEDYSRQQLKGHCSCLTNSCRHGETTLDLILWQTACETLSWMPFNSTNCSPLWSREPNRCNRQNSILWAQDGYSPAPSQNAVSLCDPSQNAVSLCDFCEPQFPYLRKQRLYLTVDLPHSALTRIKWDGGLEQVPWGQEAILFFYHCDNHHDQKQQEEARINPA